MRSDAEKKGSAKNPYGVGATKASIPAFGVVIALGAFYLPYPLNSDSALFLLMAREMAEGARLYVDVWDVKQPGVFWFYLTAGYLFGFEPLAPQLLGFM